MCLAYKPILSKLSKCERLCSTPATLATDSPLADVPTTKAIKQASLVSSAFEVAAYGVKLPIIDGRAANPRNSAA